MRSWFFLTPLLICAASTGCTGNGPAIAKGPSTARTDELAGEIATVTSTHKADGSWMKLLNGESFPFTLELQEKMIGERRHLAVVTVEDIQREESQFYITASFHLDLPASESGLKFRMACAPATAQYILQSNPQSDRWEAAYAMVFSADAVTRVDPGDATGDAGEAFYGLRPIVVRGFCHSITRLDTTGASVDEAVTRLEM